MSEPAAEGLRALKAQRTHAALLESAISLFQKEGYAATTINDICRVAEVSLGTFYNYFESKQAILVAFLREERRREEPKVLARIAAPVADPIDYLQDVAVAELQIGADSGSLALWREVVAALMMTSGDEVSGRELDESRVAYSGHFLAALTRLRDQRLIGPSTPLQELADALQSIIAFQFQEYVCRRYRDIDAFHQRIRTLIDVVVRPWLAASRDGRSR